MSGKKKKNQEEKPLIVCFLLTQCFVQVNKNWAWLSLTSAYLFEDLTSLYVFSGGGEELGDGEG